MSIAKSNREPYKIEILNNKIVMLASPNTNHNVIKLNIARIFSNFLRGKTCKAFIEGTDVFLTENDIVIPDVLILCDRSKWKRNGIHGAPDLIVEVLSHSTEENDRGYKKELYQKAGVKEYWIVDSVRQSIEIYLLEENMYRLSGIYRMPSPDDDEENINNLKRIFSLSFFSDLTLSVDEVFEDIMDY